MLHCAVTVKKKKMMLETEVKTQLTFLPVHTWPGLTSEVRKVWGEGGLRHCFKHTNYFIVPVVGFY